MISIARPNRINIDLQDYKQPWLEYCKARGVTPSEAFRQVVAKLTATGSAPLLTDAVETATKKIRKEVRLTRGELHRAEALAKREGFSLNRWIVALINARLEGAPQLGQHELEGLARSNLQMLAIGRNLNQLAKAANHEISARRNSPSNLIDELRTAVMEHTLQVARVMSANIERWRH